MLIFLNLSFSPYPVKMGCYVFTKAMEKKFTDLNLKEIRDEAEKKENWSFSSPSDTQW